MKSDKRVHQPEKRGACEKLGKNKSSAPPPGREQTAEKDTKDIPTRAVPLLKNPQQQICSHVGGSRDSGLGALHRVRMCPHADHVRNEGSGHLANNVVLAHEVEERLLDDLASGSPVPAAIDGATVLQDDAVDVDEVGAVGGGGRVLRIGDVDRRGLRGFLRRQKQKQKQNKNNEKKK